MQKQTREQPSRPPTRPPPPLCSSFHSTPQAELTNDVCTSSTLLPAMFPLPHFFEPPNEVFTRLFWEAVNLARRESEKASSGASYAVTSAEFKLLTELFTSNYSSIDPHPRTAGRTSPQEDRARVMLASPKEGGKPQRVYSGIQAHPLLPVGDRRP